MKIDVTSVADFNQYYGGAYVRGRAPGSVFYVDAMGRGGDVIRLYPVDPKSGTVRRDALSVLLKDVEQYIYFGLPPLGMTVYKDVLFYLAQNSHRSGARGLRKGRGTSYTLSSGSLAKEVDTNYRGKYGSYISAPGYPTAVLWPDYTPWKLGLEALAEGKVAAVALNKEWGVYTSDDAPIPQLCYKSHRVGEITPGGARLNPRFAPFGAAFKREVPDAEVVA